MSLTTEMDEEEQ